ncbi:Uncharacterised protein [Mycobacteroides abscessus subsp. abscessus]|nr:Uncharacterised protein [Mycobacteroides abscessus subsp. abscessus]
MLSLTPGIPGRKAQIPRTTISTGTPFCDARYRASITCSSTRALAFNRTRARGSPSCLSSISRLMRSTMPERIPVGATRMLRYSRLRE